MEYLSVVEAARRLGISEKTIRRAIHAGKLAARYPQPDRCEIALSDLEAWRQPQARQDEVTRRIAELERRVADLERQLQRVVSVQQAVARPVPPQEKWDEDANALGPRRRKQRCLPIW